MIIKTKIDEIQNYLSDASNFKSYSCEAVYIPSNIAEISELFNTLNNIKKPVTISGCGTGLVGGRVPLGGVVVSTEKLNRILSLNKEKKTVLVESGVILNDLQLFCKENSLLYPPDPTETNCAIGGTIAANASGAKSFKYGKTRNWVNKIKVILADGDLLELERGITERYNNSIVLRTNYNKEYIIPIPEIKKINVKNSAGYFLSKDMDAIDLFIGSEGTLGLIAEAELKLIELPKNLISFVVYFEDFSELMFFVSELKNLSKENKEINARAIEFFDNKALKFIKEENENLFGIWVEQEINSESIDTYLEYWVEFLNKFNIDQDKIWFGSDEQEQKRIREFRHSLPLKVNDYISRNNFKKVGTDIAVSDGKFQELYFYCVEKCNQNKIDYVSYGHIGDNHLHLNMLPKSNDEYSIAKMLYRDFCIEAVRLGGTISAEHGIGKLKKEYLNILYTEEEIQAMKQIKKILDPNFILGQGNIF